MGRQLRIGLALVLALGTSLRAGEGFRSDLAKARAEAPAKLAPSPQSFEAVPRPVATAVRPNWTSKTPEELLIQAEGLRKSARRAERRDQPACVDLYYRAAVADFAAFLLLGGDPQGPFAHHAADLYNQDLAASLRTGMAFHRLDPKSHLAIQTSSGVCQVPISFHGFPWHPSEYSFLRDPSEIPRAKEMQRRHAREGLGAPEVLVRLAGKRPTDAFMVRRLAVACTMILVPDLDAWFGSGRVPNDHIECFEPFTIDSVELDRRVIPLAADFDAPFFFTTEFTERLNFRIDGFFKPGRTVDDAGMYMLGPYQPGKIPVIFVHGLGSTPTTWCEMVLELQSDPEFRANYQIWVFAYPTGLPFLTSAGIFRTGLRAVQAHYDPAGTDPALHNIVLVGHSMGGLVSKAQALSSQDRVWNTIFRVSPDSLKVSEDVRHAVQRNMFFEPNMNVRRVIFIATPHQGSNIANTIFGHIMSDLVRLPEKTLKRFAEIKENNPDALRWEFRRMPTSIDMLKSDNSLLKAMNELQRSSTVKFHSIVGNAYRLPIVGEGDGVVPLPSARIPGAVSERYVDDAHTTIHHNPETILEVRRILRQHVEEVVR